MNDSTPLDFGMIGMAVMGRNLALNVADHGYTVGVWNREPELTEAAVAESGGRLAAWPSARSRNWRAAVPSPDSGPSEGERTGSWLTRRPLGR